MATLSTYDMLHFNQAHVLRTFTWVGVNQTTLRWGRRGFYLWRVIHSALSLDRLSDFLSEMGDALCRKYGWGTLHSLSSSPALYTAIQVRPSILKSSLVHISSFQ